MQKHKASKGTCSEEVITLESIQHYMRHNEAAGLIYQRVPRVHDYRQLCKCTLDADDRIV